jgi:hypothetical protein
MQSPAKEMVKTHLRSRSIRGATLAARCFPFGRGSLVERTEAGSIAGGSETAQNCISTLGGTTRWDLVDYLVAHLPPQAWTYTVVDA